MYASISEEPRSAGDDAGTSLPWSDWGSSEAERLGEDEEASDCMDSERCLLRLFVVSCAINEGELDGDGGVSIALVVVAEAK